VAAEPDAATVPRALDVAADTAKTQATPPRMPRATIWLCTPDAGSVDGSRLPWPEAYSHRGP
jgi:hypothetical protein